MMIRTPKTIKNILLSKKSVSAGSRSLAEVTTTSGGASASVVDVADVESGCCGDSDDTSSEDDSSTISRVEDAEYNRLSSFSTAEAELDVVIVVVFVVVVDSNHELTDSPVRALPRLVL